MMEECASNKEDGEWHIRMKMRERKKNVKFGEAVLVSWIDKWHQRGELARWGGMDGESKEIGKVEGGSGSSLRKQKSR
jgi:hypothetical protein